MKNDTLQKMASDASIPRLCFELHVSPLYSADQDAMNETCRTNSVYVCAELRIFIAKLLMSDDMIIVSW